jgi:hypothetical protein
VSDATHYHRLVRALQYLTFTRRDIAYVVQEMSLYAGSTGATTSESLLTLACSCIALLFKILLLTLMLIGLIVPTLAALLLDMMFFSGTI